MKKTSSKAAKTVTLIPRRALELLEVIRIQRANFDWCDAASLARALPHDPEWIREDLELLLNAGRIRFELAEGWRDARGTKFVPVYWVAK